MNIAHEIIDYIVSETSLVVGTDIFQAILPTTNDNGIVVSSSGGTESDSLMQSYMVDIACQYNDYDTASDNLTTVYNLLAYSNGFTLASGVAHNSTPIKLPGFVTITDQNKYIFSCSLICYITRP